MSLLEFGVTNLRRLVDVGPIALKPITILVGRNSSGKSTFLRSLPLIRQSILTRTSSPILWYGDFVDFGTFDTSVRDANVKNNVGFSFKIDNVSFVDSPFVHLRYHNHDFNQYSGVQYEVSIAPFGSRTRIKNIKISVTQPLMAYDADFDEEGKLVSLKVNGERVLDLLADAALQISVGSLFPEMTASRKSEGIEETVYSFRRPFYESKIIEPLAIFLRAHLHGRTSAEQINHLSVRLLDIGPFSREEVLAAAQYSVRRLGRSSSAKF